MKKPRKKSSCWKVKCKTTNSTNNAVSKGDGTYLDAEDGIIYVKANNLMCLERTIGRGNILEATRVGICY